MSYRVAFEHPGQLLDLRDMLSDVADAAAAMVGISFLHPPTLKTLQDLERFVTVELNLHEDFLSQLMSTCFVSDIPLQPRGSEFISLQIPFTIKAPKYFELPLAATLRDAKYEGLVSRISDAPDLLVVCDEPVGKYTNEVDTYSGLENTIHFLRNKA